MSELTGSEIQVAWANSIRETVFTYVQEEIHNLENLFERAKARGEEEIDLAGYRDNINTLSEKFNKLKLITDASVYIDYFSKFSSLATMEDFMSKQKSHLTAEQAKESYESHRAQIANFCTKSLLSCHAIK